MKKLTTLAYVFIILMNLNAANAQSFVSEPVQHVVTFHNCKNECAQAFAMAFTPQFTTQIDDSFHFGGGYFCDLDSVTFYDHSMDLLNSGGQITEWRWKFTGAITDSITYTTYQPVIHAKWNYYGSYRVSLSIIEVWPDSSFNYCTSSVGVVLGGSEVKLDQDSVLFNGPVVLTATNLKSDTIHIMSADVYGNNVTDSIAVADEYYIWKKNSAYLSSGVNDTEYLATDTGMYVVQLYAYGCESYDTVYVVNPAVIINAVVETIGEDFLFYPNPANDFVTIQATGNNKSNKLIIYSLAGNEVFSSEFSIAQKIDVSTFAAGMYLCNIGGTVKKFAVVH